MEMKIRTIDKQPLRINGNSLFFGKAHLLISSPHELKPYSWRLSSMNGNYIPINPETVVCSRFQNLAVKCGWSTQAHVLEHLLPLKAAGLLGATLCSSHCLPYTGCSQPFLDNMLNNTVEKTADVPVFTVKKDYHWEYPDLRGGKKAYTHLMPRIDGKLVLNISINYPGLGHRSHKYEFPDLALLKRIAGVKAQGWPLKRYGWSLLTQDLGLWRHHNNVTWPQKMSVENALQAFLDHRCLDLLGAMCLLCNSGWLSADVISECSGHLADLNVCKKVFKDKLAPIESPTLVRQKLN